MHEFLRRVEVLPWGSADRYGVARADLASSGKALTLLDLLIAAHALGVAAVLVTNDHAFVSVSGIATEKWTVEAVAA